VQTLGLPLVIVSRLLLKVRMVEGIRIRAFTPDEWGAAERVGEAIQLLAKWDPIRLGWVQREFPEIFIVREGRYNAVDHYSRVGKSLTIHYKRFLNLDSLDAAFRLTQTLIRRAALARLERLALVSTLRNPPKAFAIACRRVDKWRKKFDS
jgi:hypothetical protein